MSTPLTAAFVCNAISALLLLVFGLVYLLKREFMPYHGAALNRSWAQLDVSYRVLILALMRAVGGLSIASAFLIAGILLGPFRHAEPWALWTAPLGSLLAAGAGLYGMSLVARHTPARPPFLVATLGAILSLVGLSLSWWATMT